MNLEKLQRDIRKSYKTDLKTVDHRVQDLANHIVKEWDISSDELSLHEIKTIATTVLEVETKKLHDEVELLLAQKEQIERSLERKAHSLQESKYNVFNAMEKVLKDDSDEARAKLHQVKLQSIDLFDLLGEMVESAIVTALEKDDDGDVKETVEEVIKDITNEAIIEGSLNTIRIRKILSTILQAAIEVAEATPTRAQEILFATLKGMRSGLINSISRFKKKLAYMPMEAKQILIEDYDTIIEDLNQTDILFSQVVQTQANESSESIKTLLLEINKEMRFDLEELLHISKEAAELMRDKFSNIAKTAVKRGEKALQSQTAQEAKRMGKQAWSAAKTALGTAIKSAKDAMEPK